KADVDDDLHVREEVLSHLGGEASTPTAQQWLAFSEEAHATLQALQSNILQLTARFTAMRDEILEMQRRLRYTPSIAPVNSSAVSSGYGIRSDPFTRRPAFHN